MASGFVLSRETYTYDSRSRLVRTDYLDGTSVIQSYDCCDLLARSERDGSVTTYTHDALGRQLTMTRDGLSTFNVFNAAGDIVATYRIRTNGAVQFLSSAAYDTAGRLTASTNALNEVSTSTEFVDSSGQTLRTNKTPDLSFRVETYARDGSLLNAPGGRMFGACGLL